MTVEAEDHDVAHHTHLSVRRVAYPVGALPPLVARDEPLPVPDDVAFKIPAVDVDGFPVDAGVIHGTLHVCDVNGLF